MANWHTACEYGLWGLKFYRPDQGVSLSFMVTAGLISSMRYNNQLTCIKFLLKILVCCKILPCQSWSYRGAKSFKAFETLKTMHIENKISHDPKFVENCHNRVFWFWRFSSPNPYFRLKWIGWKWVGEKPYLPLVPVLVCSVLYSQEQPDFQEPWADLIVPLQFAPL